LTPGAVNSVMRLGSIDVGRSKCRPSYSTIQLWSLPRLDIDLASLDRAFDPRIDPVETFPLLPPIPERACTPGRRCAVAAVAFVIVVLFMRPSSATDLRYPNAQANA